MSQLSHVEQCTDSQWIPRQIRNVLTTNKTLVHLQNTNEDLFEEIKINFCPSFDSYSTTTLTLQKVHKDIVKPIYMN